MLRNCKIPYGRVSEEDICEVSSVDSISQANKVAKVICMKKILLIINPAAGKSRTKYRVFHIGDWFYNKGCTTTVLTTSKKGDAADFVKQYAAENDIVVCCGGDGTLNEVISGVMQTQLNKPIGYLPAGTTNDMAKTLHLSRDIKKSAKIILNEEPVSLDIGAFNETQFFSYIASFGAFTKVSYSTPQWLKNRFGHLAYVMDGIKSLGDIHPYHVEVISQEFEGEGDFIFGSVTNSCSVGGMLKLKETDVCLNDGKFEILLIQNPHNLLEFRNIVYNLRHHKLSEENILFFRSSKITFQFGQETEWTVDGEYAGKSKEVRIQNMHNAVQIIRKE